MAGLQTIDLTLVSPLAGAGAVPIDPWWLRIEQIVKDDSATTAEVAELVDTLYDLNPCVETEDDSAQDTAEEEVTEEDLLDAAATTFDLAACDARLNGDYTAQLKVVRSHQTETYKLVFGVIAGEVTIDSTVITYEEIDTVIDIDGANDYTLDFPVAAAFHASWQGSVSNDKGPITIVPIIKRTGNTLFWDGGSVKGSIRVVYQTVYDLLTVSVPGKPKYTGAETGDTQDVTVLAFFHRLVFLGQLSPPAADDSVDAVTLGELCGWSDSDAPPEEAEDEPIEPPTDAAEYGCITPNRQLADPEYYELKCCTPPPFGLPDCAVSASAKPGKGLDPAVIAQIIAAHYPDPVEFIAVGPGPQGCGRIITTQRVRAKACCVDVEPLVMDMENTQTTIGLPGTAMLVAEGGVAPYHWQTSGGYIFSNGLSEMDTTSPANLIYTHGDYVCGNATTRLTDGCSQLIFTTTQEAAIAELKLPADLVMAADSELIVELVHPTSPPYHWEADGDVHWQYSTTYTKVNILISSPEFCGTANINVTDACAHIAQAGVRSTSGSWVNQAPSAYGLDLWCNCSEAGSGGLTEESETRFWQEGNGWKCMIDIGYIPASWDESCSPASIRNCGGADYMAIIETSCLDHSLVNHAPGNADSIFEYSDCCIMKYSGVPWDGTGDPPDIPDQYLGTFLAIQKSKWIC